VLPCQPQIDRFAPRQNHLSIQTTTIPITPVIPVLTAGATENANGTLCTERLHVAEAECLHAAKMIAQ
jgi:hypothetical protein